ncbi:MAG: DUF1428 family protein [Devosia sp.]
MTYVDAFVVSVPKDKVESYRSMLSESAVLWKEFGALSYVESVADDVPYGELTSFPRAVQAKDDELVVLSWVTWPSREARDAGNKKVMSDPRMTALMEKLPVDGNRMIFGGFETMIEA